MSYLRFDKTLMINLQESLPREILRTNRSGAYHRTTIVDCNTRKYHGLLVIPVPNLDDENHVLLSSLEMPWRKHLSKPPMTQARGLPESAYSVENAQE